MVKVDHKRMKRDLISIYQRFLQNPESREVQEEIIDYERKWGGLSSYNDILKKLPLSEPIRKALEGLSLLYQYGMHPSTHDLSDTNIKRRAEKILEELKKE